MTFEEANNINNSLKEEFNIKEFESVCESCSHSLVCPYYGKIYNKVYSSCNFYDKKIRYVYL